MSSERDVNLAVLNGARDPSNLHVASATSYVVRRVAAVLSAHVDRAAKSRALEDLIEQFRSEGLNLFSWDYEGGSGEVWGFDYRKEHQGFVIRVYNDYRDCRAGLVSSETDLVGDSWGLTP
jgi:hypothetical protein